MGVDIKVPSVGESITEGTIARWLKKDGDAVRAEEPLFELETEKATTEVAAPVDGVLHIKVPEGQTVAIGSVVGQVAEGARTAPEPKKAAEAAKVAKTPTAPAPQAAETRQRMSAIRQRIAERLVASQQSTATLTTFNEADLSAVLALRARFKDRFKERHGVNLGFLPFFVKACVEAL